MCDDYEVQVFQNDIYGGSVMARLDVKNIV